MLGTIFHQHRASIETLELPFALLGDSDCSDFEPFHHSQMPIHNVGVNVSPDPDSWLVEPRKIYCISIRHWRLINWLNFHASILWYLNSISRWTMASSFRLRFSNFGLRLFREHAYFEPNWIGSKLNWIDWFAKILKMMRCRFCLVRGTAAMAYAWCSKAIQCVFVVFRLNFKWFQFERKKIIACAKLVLQLVLQHHKQNTIALNIR